MTSETRTFIAFSDIIGIQLECLNCGTKAILPIGKIHNYPVRCENCKHEWFIGHESGKVKLYTTLDELAKVQGWVLGLSESSVKLKLSLEIAEEKQI